CCAVTAGLILCGAGPALSADRPNATRPYLRPMATEEIRAAMVGKELRFVVPEGVIVADAPGYYVITVKGDYIGIGGRPFQRGWKYSIAGNRFCVTYE